MATQTRDLTRNADPKLRPPQDHPSPASLDRSPNRRQLPTQHRPDAGEQPPHPPSVKPFGTCVPTSTPTPPLLVPFRAPHGPVCRLYLPPQPVP